MRAPAMEHETAIGHSEPHRGIRVPAPHSLPDPARTPQIMALFAPCELGNYTAGQRLVIRLADRFFYLLIATIGPTLRWELEGAENLESVYRGGDRAIFTFWHDRIFGMTWFWRRRRIVVMTSRSFDGEYIARFIQRFGYGAARGSSTRGGGRALVEQIRALDAGFDVAFTIDGPKGPPYVAKMGAGILARRRAAAIVPVTVALDRCWRLKTWDRFQIPLPFTRAVAAIGKPIHVAPDAGDDGLEVARAALQSALEGLQARFDRHQEGGRK